MWNFRFILIIAIPVLLAWTCSVKSQQTHGIVEYVSRATMADYQEHQLQLSFSSKDTLTHVVHYYYRKPDDPSRIKMTTLVDSETAIQLNSDRRFNLFFIPGLEEYPLTCLGSKWWLPRCHDATYIQSGQ